MNEKIKMDENNVSLHSSLVPDSLLQHLSSREEMLNSADIEDEKIKKKPWNGSTNNMMSMNKYRGNKVENALLNRNGRNGCIKRYRYIVKNLGFQYARLVSPPLGSINFISIPSRGKFRDIQNMMHTLAFYMHIQDKWVTVSANALKNYILNGLYTVLVNFHAHFVDLSFHQLERLFKIVQQRVEHLTKEIQVIMKQQRYICSCGSRFEKNKQFWSHYNGNGGGCGVGSTTRNCYDENQHVCNCGLVFADHTTWAEHTLAQEWPLCGMSMLAHLFALRHLNAATTNVMMMDPTALDDVDLDNLLFQCPCCDYQVDNYFLYYVHIVYCYNFSRGLRSNCPFCVGPQANINNVKTTTTTTNSSSLNASKPLTVRNNNLSLMEDAENYAQINGDNFEYSLENLTFILCKICFLFGITLEEFSNDHLE